MKELIKEIEELSLVGDEVKATLELILDKSYQVSTQKEKEDFFGKFQSSLSGAIRLLENELVSKLYALDDYTSIKGEEYKPNFRIESAS